VIRDGTIVGTCEEILTAEESGVRLNEEFFEKQARMQTITRTVETPCIHHSSFGTNAVQVASADD